jgi:hypothetical protein
LSVNLGKMRQPVGIAFGLSFRDKAAALLIAANGAMFHQSYLPAED